MKVFSNLSDTHKERAIHHAEHMIINTLLEDGVFGDPKTDEEKEDFKKLTEAVKKAQSLPEEEQIEFLFENDITGEFIFEKAHHLASTAIYTEKDETVFSLAEIDAHYEDMDDEEEIVENIDADEKEMHDIISSNVKRDNKQLN